MAQSINKQWKSCEGRKKIILKNQKNRYGQEYLLMYKGDMLKCQGFEQFGLEFKLWVHLTWAL